MTTQPEHGAIGFGEKLLGLLDRGQFVATYKYAVLLGLIDLCLEHATGDGAAPPMVTTRQLAQKVIELYWPQTSPFRGERVLRQNTSRQAAIVTEVARFRDSIVADSSAPLFRARHAAPDAFEALVDEVEWKLIEMPLPKLQRIGTTVDSFVYRIAWDDSVTRARARLADFDNRILFVDGAGEHLIALAGLLRPLLHREWAAMVARINDDLLPESQLEDFLFGASRVSLTALRGPLSDLQGDRCFYCGDRLTSRPQVDHFLPWARYPDNDIDNLVVADSACNSAKRDFLAAAGHVRQWRRRLVVPQLDEIAANTGWQREPLRTLNIARALYLRLPTSAKLWESGREFVDADRSGLLEALAAG